MTQSVIECGGLLSPWANPLTDALGWQLLTPSRCLAQAVAGDSGTVRADGNGAWHARIAESSLSVAVVGADDSALWCRPAGVPGPCALTVAFAPWTPATVLKCPVTALPAAGTLSVRDVQVTTRMGRLVRFLVPVFTPP